jgi:3-hydroxymyristoyl/3-hydroxydecanoyl-(acyl carrier protein) dehydratase
MRLREEVSPLHPALAGHFPGDPVVPGVVILGRVCRALMVNGPQAQDRRITAVSVVKFHAPLRPAEPFDIEFEQAGGDRYGFRVVRGDTLIAAGTVQVSAVTGAGS